MHTVAAVRVAYGVVSLAAPERLLKLDEPEPRYFNALFGGRDLTVAAAIVLALRAGREREAWALNATCEVSDLTALLLELRRRGGFDETLAAAAVFSAGGWATTLVAKRKL